MNAYRTAIVVFVALISSRHVNAAIYDGSITGDNYGARAVQTVQTGYGDDLDNDNTIKGSELDAAYARVDAGVLNITLTGNLEDNFNKLVLFFDSVPGGINTIDGNNLPVVDPTPFSGDPGMLQKMSGWVFDASFEADYVLVLRHGFTGSENRFDADFAVLNQGAAGPSTQYLGVFLPTMSPDWFGSGATGTSAANTSPISVAMDNSNVAGVVAGSDAADQTAAAAVTTGIEIGMPLSNLGDPTSDIKITAFVAGSNHDHWSNQFLGGLPAPALNVGNLAPNLEVEYAGNQYFTVSIPEPSPLLLMSVPSLLASLGWLACAKWKKQHRCGAISEPIFDGDHLPQA